jgi:hypothetical protein
MQAADMLTYNENGNEVISSTKLMAPFRIPASHSIYSFNPKS